MNHCSVVVECGTVVECKPLSVVALSNAKLARTVVFEYASHETMGCLCDRLDNGTMTLDELCEPYGSFGETVYKLAKRGHWTLVERLLASPHRDERVFGSGDLYMAALTFRAHPDVFNHVKMLLHYDVPVYKPVLLHWASRHSADVFQLALDMGGELDTQCATSCGCTWGRGTPLLTAVFNINVDAVRMLLTAGANKTIAGKSDDPACSHLPLEAAILQRDRFVRNLASSSPYEEDTCWITGERMNLPDFIRRMNEIIELLRA